MKYVVFFVLLLMMDHAGAQGIYGFEGGVGSMTNYETFLSPTVEANYLKMVFPHVYLGGAIDWRAYNFTFHNNDNYYPDPNYGSIVYINHHSTYLFLSPMVDVSIGENQFIHLNATIGPGFYLFGGEQTTYLASNVPVLPIFNSESTSGNSNRVIYQYSYGITESIPTKGFWSIRLSQQYSVLGRDLNSNNGIGPTFRSNFYSFTIGIAHYYNKIFY